MRAVGLIVLVGLAGCSQSATRRPIPPTQPMNTLSPYGNPEPGVPDGLPRTKPAQVAGAGGPRNN